LAGSLSTSARGDLRQATPESRPSLSTDYHTRFSKNRGYVPGEAPQRGCGIVSLSPHHSCTNYSGARPRNFWEESPHLHRECFGPLIIDGLGSHCPSGEKNGLSAPSVPRMGIASHWSSFRAYRRVVPFSDPTNTRVLPSGESTNRGHTIAPNANETCGDRSAVRCTTGAADSDSVNVRQIRRAPATASARPNDQESHCLRKSAFSGDGGAATPLA